MEHQNFQIIRPITRQHQGILQKIQTLITIPVFLQGYTSLKYSNSIGRKEREKISYTTVKENCKENRNITKKLLWLPPGLKSDRSGSRPGFLFPFHHDAILKIYIYILDPQPCNRSHKTPKFNDMI
jgi:hypothetical protein